MGAASSGRSLRTRTGSPSGRPTSSFAEAQERRCEPKWVDRSFQTDARAKPARPSASLAMPSKGHAGFAGLAVLHRGTASCAPAMIGASIDVEGALLALKAAFLVLLYVFIWRIVRTGSRDLRLPQES